MARSICAWVMLTLVNWLPTGPNSGALRELENSSHHYGHDVQLKRHAGLSLIGRPLPWLLEHGLKVSRGATFEAPQSWARGYLCMGPLRAAWLRDRCAAQRRRCGAG
mgnify:CR=1 FL=1